MTDRSAESLAARALPRVPALTDALVRRIEEENPGYRAVNVVPTEDLWRSCHDNITRILQLLAGHGDGRPDPLYDAARETGRRRAEQRMPLDDVLRSFRFGGRLVWEALLDQARADGTVDDTGLLPVATRVWEVIDETSAQVAAAYHAAERHLVRADEQRRATLWEGLLQGRARDLAFAHEAARMLGVPVAGRLAVVAVDVDPDDDRTADRLARGLTAAGVESAWQVRARTLVGLLTLGDADLDAAAGALRSALTAPAGLSLVVTELAEVSAAYQQAALARRTLPVGRAELAQLADRLPEALLLSAPDLAGHLVRRWLGPLLALPAGERALLLDTLETWVRTAGSVTRTAELAHCHRNTVLNRLHRIQSITGRDLSAPHAQADLSLALRAARLLPPATR